MVFKLELNQNLKLGLSIEMKLSIDILKMGLSELKNFLEKKEQENKDIEIIYSESKNKQKDNSVNYLNNISEGQKSLIDYLEEQIMYLNIEKELKGILNYIINNLDEKGYINGDLEDLRKIGCFKVSHFEEALGILRTLEPFGVGAINLVDCLKIQIQNKGIKDKSLEKIVENNLMDIANKNFFKIASERMLEISKVKYYIEIIRTLNPKPARGYFVNKKTEYIIPDLILNLLNDNIFVSLNEDDIPRINITNLENKNNCNEALVLERCIQKRQKTLFKVGQYILNYQKDYFLYEKPLKTLKIKDVASYLNLNESTISRAIKNKFVKNKNKINSLRKYIVLDEKSEIIKNKILNYIKNENKKKPLSDEVICNLFLKEEIKIDRRTITKYRNDLGIVSSHKRKLKTKK
ncbi:MAG: RNA polymerase factor sigma-54 [Cetobacterium sp.]